MMYDEELVSACNEQLKIRVRYTMLYSLLKRVCIEKTKEFSTDYSGLFDTQKYFGFNGIKYPFPL